MFYYWIVDKSGEKEMKFEFCKSCGLQKLPEGFEAFTADFCVCGKKVKKK